MALLIEKNITILGEIDIDQIYSRLTISYGPIGSKISIAVDNYYSVDSYESNRFQNKIEISGIPKVLYSDYDRNVTTDLLLYAHQYVFDYLTTDKYGDVPVIDPSTGEIVLDPSTGLQETENVVITEKFATDSSVNIIDI